MFRRMRISHRLLLLVPVLLATLITIVWFGLSELRQSLLSDRKEAVKNLVQVASHVLEVWYAREKSQMTVPQDTVIVGHSASKERKVAFEKFVLEVQKMPSLLQIDMQMRTVISPRRCSSSMTW